MREIEFRAKSIDDNEWIYGSLVGIIDINRKKTYHIIDEFGIGFNIDQTTIGQFTGLGDKHYYKIYEGDILQRKYNDGKYVETCVVRFSDFGVCFDGFNYDLDIETNKCEVIGNIYDNPDLLKGE